MSFLPEIFPSLMRWREPNAYSRKDLSPGRRIGFLIFLMIPSLLLSISAVNHDFSKGRIILAIFFMATGIIIFIRIWFGPGDVIRLKEDCVIKGSGAAPRKTSYEHILSCTVCPDSYNNIRFSIVKFALKKGLAGGQITQVVVPDDGNLERVLQILRDKGVNVVEGQLAS